MRALTGFGLFLVLCLVALPFLTACGGSDDSYDVLERGSPVKSGSPSDIRVPILTPEQGKNMINFKCVECHTNTRIKDARLTAVEWEARILRCKEMPGGAKIAPLEARSLSTYLANKYRD